MPTETLPQSDVVIAGAGIIGLALALELHARGANVTVLERDTALSHASTAAAGMLAVDDPANPPALHPLSTLSRSLYPAFLERIHKLGGHAVPFQTNTTVQYSEDLSSVRLPEASLDPRQLAAALLAAVQATPIELREHTSLHPTEDSTRGVTARTSTGEHLSLSHLVYTSGAWTAPLQYARQSARSAFPITPSKGQMLRVSLPPALRSLDEVHRSERIYVVPRTNGEQAGSALIGATVEDAGFDTTTDPASLASLRSLAAELLPPLGATTEVPMLEAWAGLRPTTPDKLPLLGRIGRGAEFLATGHFRNGILLAPATAQVLADLIEGKTPAVDLSAFAPQRFEPHS